ncbi:MAG TPA: VWA domain-containing protein [Pyrinomonadaceae bacterium]|nr:VWA domain-containing protein [Pyrinomonadaceae bacterium]
MNRILALLCVIALTSLTAASQGRPPAPAPTPPATVQPADDDNVVRVTTNLIQIDVVVTDSKGRPVTNLNPEDFEILVNGKPQTITNFSLITLDPQPSERTKAPASKNSTNAVPLPPVPLKAAQVNRTIALIVDDVRIDCKNLPYVRKALKKFADEQMQPGDLVAIFRVGSSIGALQQFTSDRQQLYAAIDRVQFSTAVGPCFGMQHPVNYLEELYPALKETDRTIRGNDDARQLQDVMLGTPGLTATNYVIKAMRDLPGRKAVMLFSDGMPPLGRNTGGSSASLIRDALLRLVDSANRAGVTIYTVDSRGLVVEGLTAADLVSVRTNSMGIANTMHGASRAFSESQDGLILLAERAGGFAIKNTNDIPGGIRRALDDQKSYYLIGYQPDSSVFNPSALRFNRLKVRVKGSGLKVRHRSGFFGVKDEASRTVATTTEQKILRALTSPFASDGISLRLTALYANDPKAGSFMRTLVHVPATGLVFSDKPENMREAVLTVAAYTFGDNGAVVDSVGEIHTITLTDKLYKRALESGFVYSLDLPIKKGGPYQVRVAVRDSKSEKIGTASQFVVVPDFNKQRLMLSGIALSSYNPKETAAMIEKVNNDGADIAGSSVLTQAALRRFQSGNVLQFAYTVYNATASNKTPPRVTTQIKVYRDGNEIFAGKETPFEVGNQTDWKRLVAEGNLQLGALQEGEYVLQVIVTDELAKGNKRTTRSWIDFAVEK